MQKRLLMHVILWLLLLNREEIDFFQSLHSLLLDFHSHLESFLRSQVDFTDVFLVLVCIVFFFFKHWNL